MSFTQCSPTCGRMPLPSLSLWPGRQPYRPRLAGDRRGGGPSSVAPCSRNPPTGHRRDSPISSSLFSHGQPCAQSVNRSPAEPVLSRSSWQRLGHLQSHFDRGWHVCQAVFPELQQTSRAAWQCAWSSSATSICLQLVGDGIVDVCRVLFGVCVPCGRQQSSWCVEERYRPASVQYLSSLVM